MSKRSSLEVRKAILQVLSDGKSHSFGDTERKADTNWQTVRTHCEDLQFFNAASISPEVRVTITKHELELLKKP